MTDLSMMNSMLGPSNQAISQNLQFLRDFKQYGYAVFDKYKPPASPQTPPAPVPGMLPPPGMSGMDAMYLQGMMQQMQRMMETMGQMSAILQQVQASGINLKDAGLSDEQITFLQKSLPSTDASTPKRNAAIAYVGQFLKKESHEANAEDADGDGNVVGAGDIAQLKAAVEDGVFTAPDLSKAFQVLLVKSSANQVDELLSLFTMAEADSMVNLQDLLKPKLIDRLDADRRAKLAESVAASNLLYPDGKSNPAFLNVLMSSQASDATEAVKQFGQQVLQKLTARFLPGDPSTDSTPEREQLVHLLHLMGIRFNDDGSLAPDEQQPFPLSPNTVG